jgi:hypothetical protein
MKRKGNASDFKSVKSDEAVIDSATGKTVFTGPLYGKPKPDKEDKIWVTNPRTGFKRQERRSIADNLVESHGWEYGQAPGQAPGGLTDSAVLQNIREITNYDQAKTAGMWSKYQGLRQQGMDRGQALEAIQNESVSEEEQANLTGLSTKYSSPAAIRKAYKNGEMSEQDATRLLQTFHGYK